MMKQTDSKFASIRGWGCYICTLAYIAGVRDIKIVDEVFPKLKEKGYIWDNDIPTTKDNWWRSFVVAPKEIIETFGESIGRKIRARHLWTRNVDPKPTSNIEGFYVIGYTGGHFGLTHPVLYNPDPNLKFKSIIKEWRLWTVGRIL